MVKLREWTTERLQTGRQRPPEQKTYGDCPKCPALHLRGGGNLRGGGEGRKEEAFGWQGACDCLKRMRILNAKLAPTKVRVRVRVRLTPSSLPPRLGLGLGLGEPEPEPEPEP